ncbi:hypothetical protein BDV96DRAFT_655191 [Lophiotrema nucula]|uniref:F-box domain-containing protein n=1 Tax=Lophiotrema nucula TaxID=690887 RepID=A0A6A5YHU3_9PLEO|nr:hypothetical protein BDV96DRAFT_655191 [Lophiotrema nucula]
MASESPPAGDEFVTDVNNAMAGINQEEHHNQATTDIDKLILGYQEKTTEALSRHFLKYDVLVKHCPLDGSKLVSGATFTLGALDKVPIEVHHAILRDLDVKSLLLFRSVNKCAMGAVDSVLEYKKIIDNAPNVVRMAIGTGTAGNFTIMELFEALCRRTCDHCGDVAPYIDLLGGGKPERMCMGLSNVQCRLSIPVPLYLHELESRNQMDALASPACFRVIPGDYGLFRFHERCKLYCKRTAEWLKMGYQEVAHIPRLAEDALTMPDQHRSKFEARLHTILASWLHPRSLMIDCSTFCDICRKQSGIETTWGTRRFFEWSKVIEQSGLDRPLRSTLLKSLRSI